MSDKQNVAIVYGAPVAAGALVMAVVRSNLLSGGLKATMVCIICGVACVLTAIGLWRTSRSDATWLPSFMALATFKVLAFCSLCAYGTIWIKDRLDVTTISRTAPPIEFSLLLTFAPLIGLCLLLSVFAFLAASLVVSLVPRVRESTMPTSSRIRAAQAANIAAFCIGLVFACVVYRIG